MNYYIKTAQTMKQIAILLISLIAFAACSDSDPEPVDPVGHERTAILNERFAPQFVGSWHYEYMGNTQRFFERLTFRADSTFTGARKWQRRERVTVGGEDQYTDWEPVEGMTGAFKGTWSLRYWSPDGGEKRDCLLLDAKYITGEGDIAYAWVAAFDYISETSLRFRSPYFNDEGGWANYRRGDGSPSF